MLFNGLKRLGLLGSGFIFLGMSISACASSTPSPLPTNTSPPLFITPYWSPTPTKIVTRQASVLNTPTAPPTPTPTPVTYQVTRGDTMLGIAFRFGVSLEDLLAANPEVDPRFLSVDTQLVIPQIQETPQVLATPTPPSVEMVEPVCYGTLENSLWCFLLIENDQVHTLENISAWIGIYTSEGENMAGKVGITPLNILPSGEAIPVVVKFSEPVAEDFTVIGDRFNALVMPENTERYLSTNLTLDEIVIREDGLEALIQGQVSLAENSPPAKLVWVLGVAYNAADEVVGVRRWEAGGLSSEGESATVLESGDSLPFSFEVYSLGPAIERVDVLVEARP